MTNFSDFSSSLADLVDRTSPSIVSVLAPRPISGSVVGEGLILTVAHVLHADEVQVVTPDGRTLAAQVGGHDPGSDLALLKVEELNLPALSASTGPRTGELLLAVGRPVQGVQAALGLANPPQRGWLSSGAAPFRGVSGGALIDSRGGLVGVLNAGMSRGTLLAVPAERALKVADSLARTGRVPRGYLGLAMQPVRFPEAGTPGAPAGASDQADWEEGETRNRREGQRGRGRADHGRRGRCARGRLGLTIVQVEPESPAAQAGLRVGDILLALDGEPVRHPEDLLQTVRDRVGAQLHLRILRGGEEQDLILTVGER